MAQMLEDVPSQDAGEVQGIAALLKGFSQGEREFVVETLKRYCLLQQKLRRKSCAEGATPQM